MDDIISRHIEFSKNNEYFRIVREFKTERIIATLKCFNCDCTVEVDASRLKLNDGECDKVYCCECPFCQRKMYSVQVRMEKI